MCIRDRFMRDFNIVCFSIVTENPVQHLHSQVTVFNPIEELNALYIVEKLSDPKLFTQFRETGLTKMPIGNMPYIMSKCNCLNKILIQAETATDRSCDF